MADLSKMRVKNMLVQLNKKHEKKDFEELVFQVNSCPCGMTESWHGILKHGIR